MLSEIPLCGFIYIFNPVYNPELHENKYYSLKNTAPM